jgi:hypothetical protein
MSGRVATVVIVAVALAGLLTLAAPSRDASAQATVYVLQGEPGPSACGNDPCTALAACVLQGEVGEMGTCTCP